MVRTVKDQFLTIAKDLGTSFEIVAHDQLSDVISASVPERFQRLVLEVMLRLPGTWDSYDAFWKMEAMTKGIGANGDTLPGWIEEDDGRIYQFVMKISPSEMEQLSDEACRWVFAQCFAYIAFKLLPEFSEHRDGHDIFTARQEHPHAQITKRIALWWGFESELEAYHQEVESLKSAPMME